MRLNYFVLCDAAARSTQGRAILHGIFDEMHVREDLTPERPLVYPTMTIAFEIKDLNRMHKSATLRLTHDATGKVVMEDVLQNPTPQEETKQIIGMRTYWMLEFPSVGGYSVTLTVDEDEIAKTPLTVIKSEPNAR